MTPKHGIGCHVSRIPPIHSKKGKPGKAYRFVVRTADKYKEGWRFSTAAYSQEFTYPGKTEGFYQLSRRVKVFSSPNASKYYRYDPFKKKWLGSMKKL